MHLSFVNDFFELIKKVDLDVGLKKMKKIQKAVLVMKEDR